MEGQGASVPPLARHKVSIAKVISFPESVAGQHHTWTAGSISGLLCPQLFAVRFPGLTQGVPLPEDIGFTSMCFKEVRSGEYADIRFNDGTLRYLPTPAIRGARY
eukprot:2056636-Rhodomonas_salina.4